ncbi:AI-2E family transporter [Legionella cardiaca]|uniref:AI-2E family transporter n=1 Tax=Legionella cardiaca TaxID=1071983 RepID=A0ABY8AUV7_9GAMM|nr:AI-2E family transporter [Legionella cardiaca]WED44475.1 AI-2E family transporter [Legionella cardiaca]
MNQPMNNHAQSMWELKVLALLAILCVAYIGQFILFPLMLSFFLYLLLRPFRVFLQKLKFPKFLASILITTVILGIISFGVSFLAAPAAHWIDKAPENMSVIEKKFSSIKKPLIKLSNALKTAQTITEANPEKKVEVKAEVGNIGYSLFDLTTNAILLIFLVLAYLFFLLIYADVIFENLQKIITTRQKKIATNFLSSIEQDLSIYLFTFTMICICLGGVIALILWLLSVPNAILWGVMAAFLNFIPYIGPAIGIGVVFFVSLITFDSLLQIMLPPFLYWITVNIEGQIITPILLGNRLNLNPLIVFFSIVFWAWLWGIGGALLSIPFLMMIKILMSHIPSLAKYSLLLEK